MHNEATWNINTITLIWSLGIFFFHGGRDNSHLGTKARAQCWKIMDLVLDLIPTYWHSYTLCGLSYLIYKQNGLAGRWFSNTTSHPTVTIGTFYSKIPDILRKTQKVEKDKSSPEVSCNFHIYLPFVPAIPPLGTYPQKNESICKYKDFKNFIADLVTIHKTTDNQNIYQQMNR